MPRRHKILHILVINIIINLQIFCSAKGFNLFFANINISIFFLIKKMINGTSSHLTIKTIILHEQTLKG
jgi:hypothetical protein